MNEIMCTTQAELDAVSADYNGRVIIKFGTPSNRAVVKRPFIYPVVARGNSSVEARGNSSVEARGNSSVVAWENSSVVARGNSQIVDAVRNNNIEISGNARIVYNPTNIEEYIDFHGLDATDATVKLYKAVHFYNGAYRADYWGSFIYNIGAIVTPHNGFDEDALHSCGAGIHLAHKAWALAYGASWNDVAILEIECEKADVLVPLRSEGKVRARKAKVLREVPLEECGLQGKMIAKRRAKA
jgi:hypothetical protein